MSDNDRLRPARAQAAEMERDLLLYGNAYVAFTRHADGSITSRVVPPDRVTIRTDSDDGYGDEP